MFTYNTKKVCPSKVDFKIEDGKVKDIVFYGGCPGNLQAISILAQNMPVEEVITKLGGITCGSKPTSCADQLAKALRLALEKEK